MGCGASATAAIPPQNTFGIKRDFKVIGVQTDPIKFADSKTTESHGGAQIITIPAGLSHHGVAYGAGGGSILKTPEDAWFAVCEDMEYKGQKLPLKDLVVKRSGWKTVRVFVSSTFKDFHHEREILVKEIFPDLRVWCQKRRIHLVECDLRWGIPKDSTSELTLRTCLGEIDRCYADNVKPFFLNMTSERIGWIPLPGEIPQNLVDEYQWVFGLSVTEMEIVHGAYRKDNPNSIFMLRDDTFLETVPAKHRNVFMDENPIAAEKISVLRNMLESRFPPNRLVRYGCMYQGFSANKIQLTLDTNFRNRIFEFFKERISIQYPLDEGTANDPYFISKEAHDSFMKQRCQNVFGRTEILEKISDYIDAPDTDVPMLILGGPGTGKSSIMAKVADDTVDRALKNRIPGGGKTGWHVFYHFVGAVPGSTDLEMLLKRMMKEIDVLNEANMPTDLEATAQFCCSILANTNTKPVVILIDALNQLDENPIAQVMTWLPRKLAPNVRIIMSMINETPQHVNLKARESKAKEIYAPPLDLKTRKEIVTEYLGMYNKRLDLDQMIGFLGKESSANPLWLSIACEELRMHGDYKGILDKINSFPDDLLDLLSQVLSRLENEQGGKLITATLCLLEVSTKGLLEGELLYLLDGIENIMNTRMNGQNGQKEKGEKESSEKEKNPFDEQLPAFKWASVYRHLCQFLRPYGDSGEGRLDFYHRTLSKAVRRKYFKMTTNNPDGDVDIYNLWARILADFFKYSDDWDRKVEEYPNLLLRLKDEDTLVEFLSKWEVMDRLYKKDFSTTLFFYWRKIGGGKRMEECYMAKLKNMENDPDVTKEQLLMRMEKVATILQQEGQYDGCKELALKCEKMIEEDPEFEGKIEVHVEIYYLLTKLWDSIVKLNEFMTRSQIPEEKRCLEYNKKTIDLRRQLPGKHHKFLLGKHLIQLGFTSSSFALCGGDASKSPAIARQEGKDAISEAKEIFTELSERGMVAECLMTEAILQGTPNSEQRRLYEEAMALSKEVYGEYSVLTGRLYINTGIYWEETGNYNKAYEFFSNNYRVMREVFGDDHIKTSRAKHILQEPAYRRMALERGDDVPDA
ncbi:TPR repeat-containing protein DDB_G0287407-like isoform X2 [Lineus longissimus]|uniref:TPR repeat-containing protein DDB_G0287407-like isoform X2 n=1 Tax=Lineus longissimus TaxID=88925 RepID=UPI002B4C7149